MSPVPDASPARARRGARERILASAVRQIARHGIDEVRIARIAVDAGVSPALVHYHFATREALLAEAIDYSYARAGEVRLGTGEPAAASRPQRLQAMIDQCLPTTEALRDDWVLWIELWLRAVRHRELRPVAEELYARLHAWFADEIAAGVNSGEFARCDPDEVTDRTLALLDGYGVRTLIGDSQLPLARARQAVATSLARDLGLGERLQPPSPSQAHRAPRPSRARR